MELRQVLWQVPIVHQAHLVQLAEEDKIYNGQRIAGHVFSVLKLLVNLL